MGRPIGVPATTARGQNNSPENRVLDNINEMCSLVREAITFDYSQTVEASVAEMGQTAVRSHMLDCCCDDTDTGGVVV